DSRSTSASTWSIESKWRMRRSAILPVFTAACVLMRDSSLRGSIRLSAFEDLPRVLDQHRMQLVLGYALLLESGNYIVVNVQVMPARQNGWHQLFGQPVHEAGGIVGEDHLGGMATLTELGHRVHTVLEGENRIDAKAVHADDRAV